MCPLCGYSSSTVLAGRARTTCEKCGAIFVPAPCNGGVVFIQAKDVNTVMPYGGK